MADHLSLYLHIFLFDAMESDSERASEILCISSFSSCYGTIYYLNYWCLMVHIFKIRVKLRALVPNLNK